MATEIHTSHDIPDAPYYVLMTDPFFSGWGKAGSRDAVYVAPCESYDEAEIVSDNAAARGDQSRIRINTTKPRLRAEWLLMLMDREDSARWYERDGFAS